MSSTTGIPVIPNNRIECFQQNSRGIGVVINNPGVVDGSFEDYIPYLTVKTKAPDSSTVLSSVGTIDSSTTAIFNLTPTDTSLAAMDYVYDITIEEPSIGAKYTIVKDRFSILDGVRY